ncbi:MAG: flagellar protein FliS [Phycisphaerales bacterium]|nr:flagellar protein FliS [Phycisphaerales bacterium]
MTSSANYARTQILTASPAQLRSLLLKRAVQEALNLRQALAADDGEHVLDAGNRLRNVVLEMLSAVSPGVDPELLQRLRQTSVYLYRRIGDACGLRDAAAAEEVIDLLQYEQETWLQAMNRLQAEEQPRPAPGRTNLAG